MAVYYTPSVPPYPMEPFKTEYRDFIVRKEPDNSLYYIQAKEGMDLAPSLSGRFTGIERLKSAIDGYLSATNTDATTAYSPKLKPAPKRGARTAIDRAKKKTKDPIAEAIAENNSQGLFDD